MDYLYLENNLRSDFYRAINMPKPFSKKLRCYSFVNEKCREYCQRLISEVHPGATIKEYSSADIQSLQEFPNYKLIYFNNNGTTCKMCSIIHDDYPMNYFLINETTGAISYHCRRIYQKGIIIAIGKHSVEYAKTYCKFDIKSELTYNTITDVIKQGVFASMLDVNEQIVPLLFQTCFTNSQDSAIYYKTNDDKLSKLKKHGLVNINFKNDTHITFDINKYIYSLRGDLNLIDIDMFSPKSSYLTFIEYIKAHKIGKDWIIAKDFYKCYSDYCTNNGLFAQSGKVFGIWASKDFKKVRTKNHFKYDLTTVNRGICLTLSK